MCYSFAECLSYHAERERETLNTFVEIELLVPSREYKLITEVSAMPWFDVLHLRQSCLPSLRDGGTGDGHDLPGG